MANTNPEDTARRQESVSLAIKASGVITSSVSGEGLLALAKEIDEFVVGQEAK